VEVTAISVSPDYAQDRTFVVRSWDKLFRSTDRGETLEEWTPRVAFTSDRDGNREVYTMDPDGRNKRRVTADPASDEVPAWSPAWTRIAFQSDRSGNWDIYSIRADCDPAQPDAAARCDLRQLTDDPGDDMLPAWSPDGRTIAFVSTRDGNPEIYFMQSDGRNPYRLTENQFGDWRPAWLSDNERLVFTSDRSGNNDLYLAEPPGAVRSFSEQEWSPMLEHLAEQLTTDPADDRDPATATAENILFLSDRDGTMTSYELHLAYEQNFVYSRGDAGLAESHPSWDAFGDRLFVAREEDGAWDIYRVAYDDPIRLTNTRFFDGHPAGSPVWWEPERSESQ
jgi:TolB protein